MDRIHEEEGCDCLVFGKCTPVRSFLQRDDHRTKRWDERIAELDKWLKVRPGSDLSRRDLNSILPEGDGEGDEVETIHPSRVSEQERTYH